MHLTRRSFLADSGMGLTGLALGSLLLRDGRAHGAQQLKPPHFTPKVRSVICVFLGGGGSQIESFAPKPTLDKYACMKVSQTPFAEALSAEKNPFALKLERGAEQLPLMGMQTGFQKHGQS